MAHVDLWDIFKDVPQEKLVGHFKTYMADQPDNNLIENKSTEELAELLVTASTGAEDDFCVTKVFDYAMKFIRHDG
ncbi:hypothetical protein QP027_09315 [Corynebacterium breve]|uniref:Uncharacterized protein n=1 Tax=Corynebacterium breve TaxID=3049799 RepID=A0ABY8VDX3_9CORY|nr:hypothetical protein [Corynebacterium breve]WIM67297.1 hypothetical protein QP027_09315 [Corynebacterium breve]